MWIRKIEFSNFRCYKKKEFSFKPGCSIIVGDNAIGKSSIIEGVSVLGTTKSFRKAKDTDMALFGAENYYIQSIVQKDDKISEYKISVSFSDGVKKVSKNDNIFKRISDYLSCLLVVSFSSFDFQLIRGVPLERRKFLNLLNLQFEPRDALTLNEYEKILKERNFLLKNNKITNENKKLKLLEILSFQLIEKGKKIIALRKKIIDLINEIIALEYSAISGSLNDFVKIEYINNVSVNEYESVMTKSLNEDLLKGSTSRGPHKDDFIIMLNGRNISICGSQGQQRDALIALKLSVTKLMSRIKKENPVLLLDDVFSELDAERQNKIIERLDKKMQTIITTTTLSDIKQEILSTANIIELK